MLAYILHTGMDADACGVVYDGIKTPTHRLAVCGLLVHVKAELSRQN